MATTAKADIVYSPHVHIKPPTIKAPPNDPTRLAFEHTTREINRIFTLLWNEIAKKKDA